MASVVADGAVARRQLALVGAIALVAVALDQLTKWWVLETVSGRTVDLFWTLRLRVIRNFGGSFGLAEGSGVVIGAVGIGVVAFLLWLARRPRPRLFVVALGCFVGGALGNLVDRLFRSGDGFLGGGVVDFIDPQWWPVFNVADVVLAVGIGLVLISGFSDQSPDDGTERT